MVHASSGVRRLPSGDEEQGRRPTASSNGTAVGEGVEGTNEMNKKGFSGKPYPREVQCEEAATRTRDLTVTGGEALPLHQILRKTYSRIEMAPWSPRKLLEHLKLNYGNPPVWIHENGYADAHDTLSKAEYDDDEKDDNRAEFLQGYLEALYHSIRNGSDARGYFVWSFLDVFEYLFGYSMRFGLCGVDMRSQGRTRYVRNSARWYSGFLAGGELRPAASSQRSDFL